MAVSDWPALTTPNSRLAHDFCFVFAGNFLEKSTLNPPVVLPLPTPEELRPYKPVISMWPPALSPLLLTLTLSVPSGTLLLEGDPATWETNTGKPGPISTAARVPFAIVCPRFFCTFLVACSGCILACSRLGGVCFKGAGPCALFLFCCESAPRWALLDALDLASSAALTCIALLYQAYRCRPYL